MDRIDHRERRGPRVCHGALSLSFAALLLVACASGTKGGKGVAAAWKPRPVTDLFDKPARRAALEAFAQDYIAFVSEAKTERLVVRRLEALARERGARTLAESGEAVGAGRIVTIANRGKSLAIGIVAGKGALEATGVNIFVASIGAPALGVKQNALFEKEGYTLWDTRFLGPLAEHRWLSVPLALYGFVARDADKGAGIDVSIGDAPGDPVFVAPDLLPHLARKAQAQRIVEPENLDAIAGFGKRDAVAAALAERYRLNADDFAHAELAFVPAGRATFIGVDRGFIAGYGHSARAAAFAFARGVLDAKPTRTTLVVFIAGASTDNTAMVFVRQALGRLVAASKGGGDLDEPALRRVLSKSVVFVAESAGGAVGQGPVMNQVLDDAFPRPLRAVLRAFDRERVPYQVVHKRMPHWPILAREFSTWNVDAVGLTLAVSDVGAPIEVVSSVDVFGLYSAARALSAVSE